MIMFAIIKEAEFVSLISDEGEIAVPVYRICQLPTSLRKKFETQKSISFRVLTTAISFWLLKDLQNKEKK